MIVRYRRHKYTWEPSFDLVRHMWSFVGAYGGVHFHVSIPDDEKFGPSAGLEFHHARWMDYRRDEAPDHINCWLTGGACWHDGTSLYPLETLWPTISRHLETGDHKAIFSLLEREADLHWHLEAGPADD